ncbi:hypothetical protein WN51_01264 [Melipona quadrifasciata]|uniref:Uncharacterized protein n=1 Tax=Melipona quadrifasciata TaxID=166423 RepID=A0A0M8ZZG3_9HYME|nr:hypothetical protein WN51_01264 [Melipona quadrifasciata]
MGRGCAYIENQNWILARLRRSVKSSGTQRMKTLFGNICKSSVSNLKLIEGFEVIKRFSRVSAQIGSQTTFVMGDASNVQVTWAKNPKPESQGQRRLGIRAGYPGIPVCSKLHHLINPIHSNSPSHQGAWKRQCQEKGNTPFEITQKYCLRLPSIVVLLEVFNSADTELVVRSA